MVAMGNAGTLRQLLHQENIVIVNLDSLVQVVTKNDLSDQNGFKQASIPKRKSVKN